MYGVLLLLCTFCIRQSIISAIGHIPNWLLPQKGWYWLENNDLSDCVCGISYNDWPIGIGVFFDLNLVLTSATSIEPYVNDLKSLKVHSIYGAYDNSMSWSVTCAIPSYPAKRRDYWQPLGYDGNHSGIHDLMVLYAESYSYDLAPEAVNASYRHAFSSLLATENDILLKKGFIIPGFGFVDNDHIRRMNVMEIENYDLEVLVDCDDYIPRDWGVFICIANVEDAIGVQSGSPLIQGRLTYGIGSFALEKGNDKILVFTDIRHYVRSLYYCFQPGDQLEWKSRHWKE